MPTPQRGDDLRGSVDPYCLGVDPRRVFVLGDQPASFALIDVFERLGPSTHFPKMQALANSLRPITPCRIDYVGDERGVIDVAHVDRRLAGILAETRRHLRERRSTRR